MIKKILRFIFTIALVIMLACDVMLLSTMLNPDKNPVMADWMEDMIAELENDTGDEAEDEPVEIEPAVTETITGEIITELWQSELVTYHKLSEEEKYIYNLLRDGIASHAEIIEIEPEVEKSILEKCLTCVYMDYPEYYWYDNNYTYWMIESTGLISSIEPEYLMTEDEIEANESIILTAADAILRGVPAEGSTYDKVKHIYESLILFTEYDTECAYNQSMASVFLQGKSVCAGYAKAVQYLLHEIGIPCTYISGSAIPFTSENGNPEPHAWNIVEINGQYYYIDATWGDPVLYEGQKKKEIEYGYLCSEPQNFEQSHFSEPPVKMPACTSEDLEYYRMNQMYYETFDYEEINGRLVEMTENGQTRMEFAFATDEAYEQMLVQLMEYGLADGAGEMRAVMTNADRWQWSISYNDYLRSIQFEWVI